MKLKEQPPSKNITISRKHPKKNQLTHQMLISTKRQPTHHPKYIPLFSSRSSKPLSPLPPPQKQAQTLNPELPKSLPSRYPSLYRRHDPPTALSSILSSVAAGVALPRVTATAPALGSVICVSPVPIPGLATDPNLRLTAVAECSEILKSMANPTQTSEATRQFVVLGIPNLGLGWQETFLVNLSGVAKTLVLAVPYVLSVGRGAKFFGGFI